MGLSILNPNAGGVDLSDGTPIGELTATWNDGAGVFTGIGFHVVNTDSSPYSALLNLGEKDGETLTPFMRFLASNKLELYKTWTDETNFERLQFYWTTGGFPDAMVIEAQYAGTGTGKDLRLQAHGDKYINIGAGGITLNGITYLNGAVRTAGLYEMGKVASEPATTYLSGGAYHFVLLNEGTGKHEYYVKFPTGAAQLLATEP